MELFAQVSPALLTKSSNAGHGSTTGLLSSFDSLGRIIGPPLGGWLFSITLNLPYISGIALSMIALCSISCIHSTIEKN